jgi:hypothetical protein
VAEAEARFCGAWNPAATLSSFRPLSGQGAWSGKHRAYPRPAAANLLKTHARAKITPTGLKRRHTGRAMPTRKHVPISPQSLPRFIAWVWLWLLKHAWFLAFGGPEADAHLRRMRRAIASIIVIRAAHRFPKRAHKAAGRISAPPGFRQSGRLSGQRAFRALVGRKLWRALRARGRGAWLCALFAALQDIDAWTGHVARRFARRLTRLYPITPAHPPARAFTANAPLPAPLSADTS